VTALRSALGCLDRAIGRGSYHWLRCWLDPGREYTQIHYARTLRQLVTPGTRWLDGGCGHLVSSVWPNNDERTVVDGAKLAVGCDAYFPALVRHRSLERRVASTLQALPFRPRSFNLITLNMVVEHFDNPERVFTEIARVLDAGGRVFIHTPNAASYFVFLIRVGRRLLPAAVVSCLIKYLEGREPEDVFLTHYRANTRATLRRLARDSGLEEEQTVVLLDRPLFYFFLPLSLVELVATRLLERLGLREIAGNTILGIYRRPHQT